MFSSIYDGFKIVEPYFQFVMRSDENSEQVIKLSSSFGLEYFNKKLSELGYPNMVKMDEFIHLRPCIFTFERKN